jgi:hypothetical protein
LEHGAIGEILKKTRVEIQFTADHRFSQVLTGPDGTIKRQAGTWHLSGAYLDISDILENESVSGFNASSWKKSDALWWFADDRGFLELMGANLLKTLINAGLFRNSRRSRLPKQTINLYAALVSLSK